MHPKKEKTFVAIKPDGIHRSLAGEIIGRIERTGLKLIGMKMTQASEAQLLEHYGKDDEWYLKKGTAIVANRTQAGKPIEKEPIEYGKDIINALVEFMTASPIIVMAFEGNQAVGIVKKIVGGTEPLSSDVGTIRGDFTLDSYDLANFDERAVRNLIHCSDHPDEAKREIAIWFRPEELHTYIHINERMLYDVNLDGLSE
jgi:nucleoside-diphosphate kinase